MRLLGYDYRILIVERIVELLYFLFDRYNTNSFIHKASKQSNSLDKLNVLLF